MCKAVGTTIFIKAIVVLRDREKMASKHKIRKSMGGKPAPKMDVYDEIDKAMEDPKFRKAVKEFIELTTS
jgi:hypothetical protein